MKKKSNTGKRYTQKQKERILAWADRNSPSSAAQKYRMPIATISRWRTNGVKKNGHIGRPKTNINSVKTIEKQIRALGNKLAKAARALA